MVFLKNRNLHNKDFVIVSWLLLALLAGISSFQDVPPPDTAAARLKLQRAIGFMEAKQFDAAIPVIRSAIDVFEQAGANDAWMQACKKLDLCFYSLNKPDEGISFFEKALKKTQLSDTIRANLYLLLADNYYLKGNYPRAIETYETGLSYAENNKLSNLLMRFYGNLGWLYWDAGNHAKALEFQKKSLQLAILKKDSTNIPTLLRDIGDTYRSMDDPQSLDYFRRALSLAPRDVQARIQCSKAFQQFNMPDSAMAMLRTVLPLMAEETEKADAFYQFAWLFLDLKDLPKAIDNITKALKHGLAGYGKEHKEYARMTMFAGKIYLAKGDADRALYWFDYTLHQQSLLKGHPEDKTRPTLQNLAPGSYWVLGSLEGKGKAFYQKYQRSKNIRNLYSALEAFDLGLLYGEKMRLTHSQESSKLELYEYLHPIVEGGVCTALELAAASGDSTFIEKAFLFAERAKAPVMAEALYDKEIKHVAGIPDSVLEHEKLLQEEVVSQEMAVNQEPENDSLGNALLNTQLDLESLKDALKTRYPRYFELKYAFSKQSNLQQIRENIPEDALLVQYLAGDSALYSFAISKRHIKAYTIPLHDSLYATLAKFRRSVSDWNFVQSSAIQAEQEFIATAPLLYQWLLAKPLAEVKARKLIIVPDGYLGLIPFEALLTTPFSGHWNSRKMPYLIRDYAIGYAWSASALKQTKNATRPPRYNFIGIGTEYDTTSAGNAPLLATRDLGPLPNADDEVKAIGDLLHGKTLINAAATKENFLASAPDCGMLHIATHGLLNEENPMFSCLVFNPSKQGSDNHLYALELYNVQLQAHMAVLSACNTGQGKVHNGEGVMSLARAFAYAGCPTLVSSLWSVNDQSTAKIMKGFYQLLEAGMPVDKALQEAKVTYLDAATSEYGKPIYWAGFIVIGQSDALPEYLFPAGHGSIWWMIAGGVVLVGGLLYFFRFKRRKTG